MAMNSGRKKGVVSDINVTPLVDVMLVLLVIFMISAPLMYSGVKLNLPKTKKVNSLKLKEDQVIISISSSGDLFIGKEEVDESKLISRLKEIMGSLDEILYIRADEKTMYGTVAAVMAQIKASGISKISLVTKPSKDK